MFPYWDSCSSSNCGQPFPYSINHQHHTMEGSSSSSVAAEAAASLSVDSNLNSSLPPSLSHFPGVPFLDDEDLFLTHFLSPQHHHFCAPVPFPENDLEQEPHLPRPHDKKKKKKAIDRAKGPPRKMRGRSKGKKDRHSKICTAKGPRDRRMRLSLHIARKFFDLQDMLGFDKASKTIDWLFSKSKSAIKDLMGTPNFPPPPPPPPPRLELVSTDDEKSSKGKPRKGGACYHEPVAARESREKARARARERTKEKNLIRQSLHTELLVNPNHQTSFGGGMSGSRSPEFNNSPNSVEVAAEEAEATSSSIEHRMATVRILEEFMAMHASTGDPQFQGYAAMETNKNSSISFTTGTASTATTDSITGFDEDDLIAATHHYHHHHNLY